MSKLSPWIKTTVKLAPKDEAILLSDGEKVYYGWYDRSDDLFRGCHSEDSLAGIEWWMPLPKAPMT